MFHHNQSFFSNSCTKINLFICLLSKNSTQVVRKPHERFAYNLRTKRFDIYLEIPYKAVPVVWRTFPTEHFLVQAFANGCYSLLTAEYKQSDTLERHSYFE